MNRLKICSLVCSIIYTLLSLAPCYAEEAAPAPISAQLEAEHYTLAERIALERLSIYLIKGEAKALLLRGSSLGIPKRYRTDAIHAERVSGTYDQALEGWRIDNPEAGYGYFVEEANALAEYTYLIDYNQYTPNWKEFRVEVEPNDPCSKVRLTLASPLTPMMYHTPSGIPRILEHRAKIGRQNQRWISDRRVFEPYTEYRDIALSSEITELDTSLSDTPYSLVEDSWSKALGGLAQAEQTDQIETSRLEVYAGVELADGAEPDWEHLTAPATLRLWAEGNEPATAKYLWRIERIVEGGSEAVLNYTGKEIEYTLTESGNYRIRLECLNRDASCVYNGFEQALRVSESTLEVPNAFSPGSSPGVNDIFRVLHRSLIEFRGTIYTATGQEIFRWSNPNEGWDGRYRGNLVPTGTYYYAIDARGADGIEYKKRGVVNVLRSELDLF